MKERLLVSVPNGSYLKKKKQWVLVKLKLHDSKYKTKYVNGGENVIFQKETFIFEVNEDVYPAGEMELKVKTWEMLKSGESFCFATLPLAPITLEIRNLMNDQSTISSSSNSNNSNTTTTNRNGATSPPPIYLDKVINLKNKKGEIIPNSTLTLNFELVPENDSTTMKSLPLMFRWFPSLPHQEQVISECYCTKQAKKMASMSHTGTMYITQGFIGFRSTSTLAKNKKTLISFKEIKSIKKKIGTFYLPNAIQIRTSKKKYLFASFIHRSKAFKVLNSQWIANGGGENLDDDDDDEEDDDDNEDEEEDDGNSTYDSDEISSQITDNFDQDDDELVNINNNNNSNGNALNSHIGNRIAGNKSNSSNSLMGSGSGTNRALSPLSKTTSNSKKRSLSISGSGSSGGGGSSNSPNRGTPTLISPENNLTSSSTSSNNSNIKISIEIEDFEKFGSSSVITLTISKDSLVCELLDKIRSRLSTTTTSSSIVDQSQYILVKSKPSKKSKRNSKKLNKIPTLDKQPSLQSFESLVKALNKNKDQLSLIHTQSITLKHRINTSPINTPVNSKSNNSSSNNNNNNITTPLNNNSIIGEKKFYILEEDKTVSSYFSNSTNNNNISELLYFKKFSIVKDINLQFELVEDKSRCIKLSIDIDSKISEIFRELSTYIGKRITIEEYYLFLPKSIERGVVLNPLKSLHTYNITKSNTTIQVLKCPPFKSFIDKFKYYDKNDKNLLFELVQCCFSNSLPYMKPVDMESPQQFLDRLQRKLMIDDVEARAITKNLLINSTYKDEGILVELKSRAESLLLDSNPYYNEFSFSNGGESSNLGIRQQNLRQQNNLIEGSNGNSESVENGEENINGDNEINNDDDDNDDDNSILFKSNYEKWKSLELKEISRVMRSIIFKEGDFIGCIFINVLQAIDLKLPSPTNNNNNCYIIISNGGNSLSGSEKFVKTTTISNDNNPLWSESFLIKIKKPRSKLELLLMNNDECIGIVEINVKDELEDRIIINNNNDNNNNNNNNDNDNNEIIKEDWYSIKSVINNNLEIGKINLSIEYQYQFQEYNQYLLQLDQRQIILKSYNSGGGGGGGNNVDNLPINNPNSSINLQHRCSVLHISLYSTLFNFILEEQENYKLSLLKSNIKSPTSYTPSSVPPKFINPFDDTTNDDKEEDVWILSYFRMLLNQYSLRYGLSKSTTMVVQLSIMADRYKLEMKPSLASSTTALSNKSKNYIMELQELLEGIWEIINETPFIFIKGELKSIHSSVVLLFSQIKFTIGRFYESFPNNKPRNALKGLVQSLGSICNLLNLNITGEPQHQSIYFNYLLSSTIIIEQKKKFEENIIAMGFLQMELSSKIKQVSEISLMLIELIEIIQEEVNNTLKYESAFPIDVKITCDLIDVWGGCILTIMEDFCSWAPYHPNILPLVKRVLDYHNFTKSIAMERFKPMPLKQLFVTYVYKLLKEINETLSNCCIESIKSDDKKTLASITLGHSFSFKKFFQQCDQSLKDFDSLMWLPDSFSFVQLLEVISSQIIHYVNLLKQEFYDWIEATEVESIDGKPPIFTLNIEPCIMYNNIEQSKAKLDSLASTIHSNLLNNLKERKKQGEIQNLDKYTKQCIEDSFKLCLDDTHKYLNQSIDDLEDFLCKRIKNYLFYCFQSVLFSEPLVLKNSHFTEQQNIQENLIVLSPNSIVGSVGTNIDSTTTTTTTNGLSSSINSNHSVTSPTIDSTTTPPYVFTPIQNSQSNSSGSLIDSIGNNNNNNNNSNGNNNNNNNNGLNGSVINLRRFEKMILSQIKEFLTTKIEELYGKFRETSFKPFLRKLWIQIIQELQYLLIQRPNELKLPFHSDHVILNVDQILIVNSVLRELMVLFHRGGGGVATPILEEKLLPLRLLLSLSEMDTTSLIDQYNQNQKKLSNSMNSSSSSSSSGSLSTSTSATTTTKQTLNQLISNSLDEIISILSTRMEFDKESRTFVNKIKGVVEKPLVIDGVDISIESINVIPENEFIIEKYLCSYNGQLGLLVISSRYLGFHNLLKQVGISIGGKISVPLLNIIEVKKIKVALVFNALQIKTSDYKIFNFTSFINKDRDTVYNDIVYQIKVIKKNTTKQQQQHQQKIKSK
ncbi:hypothetical protein DDB_G0275287 [Dictyostelium discoideum AX4]|uniref:C2 domain-containing protein n=1 Tax=Dictyostelium discoideum TaxID=44689 RepID=Q553Y9_DICDI|nr:hypothetical protein DDB_G0275287 [Dictyostelium discoideum AX4]EAL69924.1 hypothetical protein DDB_G0275287 [Dictyostelium discoideum AX4]|eukprot:XP_643822.1 hypothetical protein DDB_G0275287 [Dictyostelium discoideum AX4]